MVDVMISLHCASMSESATKLQKELESRGVSVWVCLDMSGGAFYRTEIVNNVKTCSVFLPLLNDSWALSGECEDEYSLAKRMNLTSHESGRTKRTEKRRPIFVPVAFSDLQWSAYPHVELLAASTNFIVHQGANLTVGPIDVTIGAVMLSLYNNGITIDLPPSLIPKDKIPPAGSTVGAIRSLRDATTTETIKDKIVGIYSMLESATTAMQQLTLANIVEDNNGSSSSNPRSTTVETESEDNDNENKTLGLSMF